MVLIPLLVAGAAPPPPEGGAARATELQASRARFYKKLASLRWIDYAPSTFDPQATEAVTPEAIAADLQALVDGGFRPEQTGICTYGCSPAQGLDRIAEVSRKFGFGGVILGVWALDDDDAAENAAARRLAGRGLVDAICIGNEGLGVRYRWEQCGRRCSGCVMRPVCPPPPASRSKSMASKG
jgi:hypothetical protein